MKPMRHLEPPLVTLGQRGGGSSTALGADGLEYSDVLAQDQGIRLARKRASLPLCAGFGSADCDLGTLCCSGNYFALCGHFAHQT